MAPCNTVRGMRFPTRRRCSSIAATAKIADQCPTWHPQILLVFSINILINFIFTWALMASGVSSASVFLDPHTAPTIVTHTTLRWNQAYGDDTGSWPLNPKSTFLLPNYALFSTRLTGIHIWSQRTSTFTTVSLCFSLRMMEQYLYWMFPTRGITTSISPAVITLALLRICIVYRFHKRSLATFFSKIATPFSLVPLSLANPDHSVEHHVSMWARVIDDLKLDASKSHLSLGF